MADVIASFIMHLHADGTVTCSGVTQSAERTEHFSAVEQVQAAMPGSEVMQDPWAASAPVGTPLTGQAAPAPSWPQAAPVAAAQPATAAPGCPHGARRFVPAGIAKTGARAGQPYPAFWACPADRNDPSKCKSLPAA